MDLPLVGFAEVMDLVDTWTKGEDHPQSLGPEHVFEVGATVVFCAIAAQAISHSTRRSPRYRAHTRRVFSFAISFAKLTKLTARR
jgi:hypothetical protein